MSSKDLEEVCGCVKGPVSSKDLEEVCGCVKGPVSSKDLEVRERLNRPVIKVMQRHPGTQRHPGNQMPEAQYILQVRMLYDLVIDRPTCVVYRTNVTAHPSTAGVPITVLLYNGPLL